MTGPPIPVQPELSQPKPSRPKPSRKVVALVVALDLAIATGVGFGVYFATRRFGPPTSPRSVRASATVCVPKECTEVTPSVSITWAPPLAGGVVNTYVIIRDGEEVARPGSGATEFSDPDVAIGRRYVYEMFAIGDEGRGRRSVPVTVRTPIPSIEHAHFAGFYGIELVFRQIDLLSRFEGVRDPAVGDRAFQEWDIVPVCAPFKGACNVALVGFELVRHGRVYRGSLPSDARCGGEEVEGRQTVTLRVTDAEVVGRVLFVSAFKGTSEVTFRCGGDAVRAVAGITGTLPELG
jgi:hypothetical protein